MKKLAPVLILCLAQPAFAIDFGGISAGVGYGTAGMEISLAMQPSFMPKSMNLRLNMSSFSETNSSTQTRQEAQGAVMVNSKLDVKALIKLSYIAILTDYHPFNGGFRLSGGLAINNSTIEVNGVGTGIYEFSGIKTEVPNITSKSILKLGGSVVPYIGFGYGFNMQAATGLKFDIGLGFFLQGSPTVDLTLSGPGYDSLTAQQKADLNIEKAKKDVEDSLRDLNVLPHFHLGLSYKFK